MAKRSENSLLKIRLKPGILSTADIKPLKVDLPWLTANYGMALRNKQLCWICAMRPNSSMKSRPSI
jgi:hypothetical protein